MKKISYTIGKALTSAYILYSCLKEPKSGYRLMQDARGLSIANWSSGSFYPTVDALVKGGMLSKGSGKGNRANNAYRTTKIGKEYLGRISQYFRKQELRIFFSALMEGRF
ncbi:Transcriptional regulator PadR-like family protein [uncultured archaeon]|nr:Transcriptional regulator PadR-like family protein [uncultured archaeon]